MAPDSRLLQTEMGTSAPDPTPASQQGLPDDLLREAAHRLGLVCLISGGLWLSNWLAVHLIHPMPGTFRIGELAMHREWMRVFDVVGGVGFLASLGLFWYTRRSTRSARFLRLGRCEVEATWTREDARRLWETRMEAESVVTFND